MSSISKKRKTYNKSLLGKAKSIIFGCAFASTALVLLNQRFVLINTRNVKYLYSTGVGKLSGIASFHQNQ